MKEHSIQASEFKARCLSLLDDVAASHTSIVITKHGEPVARVVPYAPHRSSTIGSITLLAQDDSSYFSLDEVWDAEG